MANTDPVSGLMASMARIRNRKPDGLAAEAGTAAQAGTLQPTPKPAQPVAMPAPSSFEQVLPAPQTAQAPVATPIPQPVPETPSMGLTEPLMGTEEEDPKNTITRVAGKLMESGDGLDLADAYVLSLGFYYGIPK
jgi:hypothetical protein